MNHLYISKYPINGQPTHNERIGYTEYMKRKWWIVGLEPPLDFIVDTYQLKYFIFFIDDTDVNSIDEWDIRKKKVDIIVKNCKDRQTTLYDLGADYNLNIRVYFLDSIVEYLKLIF